MRIYPEMEMFESSALGLGDLVDEVVFVGGAIAGLHYTELGAILHRATIDVDVTASFKDYGAYPAFADKLRKSGFSERIDAQVICCWWGAWDSA